MNSAYRLSVSCYYYRILHNFFFFHARYTCTHTRRDAFIILLRFSKCSFFEVSKVTLTLEEVRSHVERRERRTTRANIFNLPETVFDDQNFVFIMSDLNNIRKLFTDARPIITKI